MEQAYFEMILWILLAFLLAVLLPACLIWYLYRKFRNRHR